MDEDTDSPFLSSQGSSLSSSGSSSPPESFLFETKYVILHFLGLLPEDLYMGHLSSSATSLASNNSPNPFKSSGSTTGVQSLPPSPPKLKTIGQVKSEDLTSPASDKNVQYQYSVNKNVENHVPELTSSPDCIADKTEYEQSLKYFPATPFNQERRLIQRRSSQSSPCLQRAMSESSCNAEFSYYSDADDEYEMSNASSAISNRSLVKTRRFVDLLQTSVKLPTLKSESLFETDQQILSSSVPNMEPNKESYKKFSQPFTVFPYRPEGAIGLSTPKEDCIEQQDRISSTGCFKKWDQAKAESGKEGESNTKNNDVEFRSDEINLVGYCEKSNNIADETANERNIAKIETLPEKVDCASKDKDEDSNNVLEKQSSLCRFKTTGSEMPDTFQTSGEFSEGSISQNIYSSIDRSKLKLEIRNNYVNWDETVLSLQSELQEELTELESEMENALKRSSSSSGFSPHSSPLTPQSKAAIMLAQIGDEVKDQYEQQLSQAIKSLVYAQLKEMSYVQFKNLAKSIMDHNLPEWRQVALLLVFSQSLVWHSLQCGQRKLGHLIEYTSQLLAELAADFIIKQGGWGAVMNIDSSRSSDLSTPLSSSSSSGLFKYYHDLNGTKVESGPWVPSATSSELLLNQENNGVFSTSENSFALTDMKDKKETSDLNVTRSVTSASAQQLHSSGNMHIPPLKNKTESLGFLTSTETELGIQTTNSGELNEELFTVNANDGSLSDSGRGLTSVTVPNVSHDAIPGNTGPTEMTKTEHWFISNLLQNVDLRILALSLGVIALCYSIKVLTQQN
ncbi:hypothetical protein CHS0354_027943 [Potamilus streckersoni]|uniref:Bcl-2 Bcl-2 homology region 1-3 domain-containing protein n=1 Tax=Potamilus streckersoni TaxID=2493646 RepID=A0AAE0W6Q8_9BIVA|nr:hypothetical protein CHS0354_027943 [Potamilus streckersoni]